MLDEREYTATDDAIKEAHYIFDKARLTDDFGNGRYVRNLIERAIKNQSLRLSEANDNLADISKKELFMLIREDISVSGENKEYNTADNVKESNDPMMKLDKMIGLSSVKSVIKKVVASAKINKYCMERGIRKDRASIHMVFTGNPGTAKTTIARLFGRIMKDESLLPTGNFVETGRSDLVGEYVGHTAVKVRQLFRKARGGILFIDEAYSLCDSDRGSFGDEAINTIVQEMENHREDTVVIFAGYPDEMELFLNRNPGLSSRIAFRVKFDDYSTEELCEITKLMVAEKDMVITDEALTKLKSNYDIAREINDYGNGRYVRKLLEEAEMNLAQRISEMKKSEISTELLTTIEECDIPECISHKRNANKNPLILPIGFKVS
jgi:SpoVK/Ycf46/Vps4 family AAA+-type ATPase